MHASAGMRRIVALSYLLVWAWHEHLYASKILGTPPARQIIFLIDDIEAHLHPNWQRRIVPGLLEVTKALTGVSTILVQLIASTHSVWVLSTCEPYFDGQQDAVFHLDRQDQAVTLERVAYARQGDVLAWLVSLIAEAMQLDRLMEASGLIEDLEQA